MPEQPKQFNPLERESAPGLGIHRDDMHSEVREYADNIARQIEQNLRAAHVTNMEEFADAVLAGRVSKQELDSVQGLLEQLNKISEKRESPEQLFDRVFMDELEKIHEEGENDVLVAEALAGYDTDQAWKIREEILARNGSDDEEFEAVVSGLAAIESQRAWKLRSLAVSKGLWSAAARSVSGLTSTLAMQLRQDILDKATLVIAQPGVDIDEVYREYLNPLLESCAGIDTSYTWELREDVLFNNSDTKPQNEDAVRAHQRALAISLAGINSEKAWKTRHTIQARESGYSLVGLSSDEANAHRDFLHLWNNMGEALSNSLIGVRSEAANKMREELPKSLNPYERLGAYAGVRSLAALENARKILPPQEQKNTAMHLNWSLPAGLRKLGLI